MYALWDLYAITWRAPVYPMMRHKLHIITCTFAFGLWPSILNPTAILQSCVFVALRNTFGKDKFDIVKVVGKKTNVLYVSLSDHYTDIANKEFSNICRQTLLRAQRFPQYLC